MKRSTLLAAMSAVFLCTAISCDADKKLAPDQGCFAHAPLETISWAQDQLAYFQRPKSGPLRVVIYSYKKESYLAFENGFVSSPMSYIFDCSGQNIAQLGIRYNDFTADAQVLKILLDEKY